MKPTVRFEIISKGRAFAVYAKSRRGALRRFYALARMSKVPTASGYAFEPLANYLPPDEVRSADVFDCSLVCDVRKVF